MVPGPLPAFLRARLDSASPQRGITSVEYALMAGIIALLLVASSAYLFRAVERKFGRDECCARLAYQGGGCPTDPPPGSC